MNKASTTAVRCFIAVEIPDSWRTAAVAVQEQLRQRHYPICWVSPERMHLTITFLGEISQRQIEDVIDTMQQVVTPFQCFSITLAALGAFPRPERARIIWCGIDNTHSLEQLAIALDERLAQWGFQKEPRPFRAHVTIGRARSRPGVVRGIELPIDPWPIELEPAHVHELVLFQSELQPTGPRYTAIARVPLGDTA